MSGGAEISVDGADGVRFVTLDRSQKRNALSADILEVFTDAIVGARSAGFGIVCLRSASPTIFCAGADVGELRGGAATLDRLMRSLASLLQALDEAEPLIVTLLQRRALGAGGVVVGLSDIVLASESASIEFPEIRMGLYPAFVHAALADRLHRTKLFQLCATGQPVLPDEALHYGLFTEILPEEDFDSSAEDRLAWYQRNMDSLLFGRELRRSKRQETVGERLAAVTDAFRKHVNAS